MEIDINTKFITLIGTPLSQSFAARMQNRGYKEAGINYRYFYTETGSEHLKQILDGIRYMPSFAGCAVTKPNKVAVMPYLDEIDPFCEKIGACNTIIKKDERLIGYNTDGDGFLKSLIEDGNINIKNSSFFCFGAGGAGHAMCSILAYHGAKKIYITDLYQESADQLVKKINHVFAPVAHSVPYKDFSMVSHCDVIMNASGIGMGKTINQSPLPEEYIRKEQFYFDACYNPDKTLFLKNAEMKGCRIMNGLKMSLYQGAQQIELWTGRKAPIEAMQDELTKILANDTE